MRRPPTKRSLTCPWCSARVPDGRQATCGATDCVRKQRTAVEMQRRQRGPSRDVVQFVVPSEQLNPWDESPRHPVFAKLDAALGHRKWRGQCDAEVGAVSRAKSALAEIGRNL
jgi:hypothetical protein